VTGSFLALLPFPYLLLASAPNGSIRVAAVQGNSDSALFSSARQGDAIQNHYDAMSAVTIGDVDAVIWPENAMDVNPLENPTIERFRRVCGAGERCPVHLRNHHARRG
jgi:apolipoprotein N-acyltransferase